MHTPVPMSSLVSLPPELINTILGLLDQNTITVLAKVCKMLNMLVTPLLYDSVQISSEKTADLFIRTINVQPEHAFRVRLLSCKIDSGHRAHWTDGSFISTYRAKIEQVIGRVHRVRELELYGNPFVKPNLQMFSWNDLKHVERITAHGCLAVSDLTKLVELPSRQELNISLKLDGLSRKDIKAAVAESPTRLQPGLLSMCIITDAAYTVMFEALLAVLRRRLGCQSATFHFRSRSGGADLHGQSTAFKSVQILRLLNASRATLRKLEITIDHCAPLTQDLDLLDLRAFEKLEYAILPLAYLISATQETNNLCTLFPASLRYLQVLIGSFESFPPAFRAKYGARCGRREIEHLRQWLPELLSHQQSSFPVLASINIVEICSCDWERAFHNSDHKFVLPSDIQELSDSNGVQVSAWTSICRSLRRGRCSAAPVKTWPRVEDEHFLRKWFQQLPTQPAPIKLRRMPS